MHTSPFHIKSGSLEVLLATTSDEILEAQKLRYRVFLSQKDAACDDVGVDKDPLDDFCDHLLVYHNDELSGQRFVVGTYRLIRKDAAKKCGGFYSASEFQIGTIESMSGEIVELGRSCIDEKFRTRPAMQLLWRGLAEYIRLYNIDVMFGCASFSGTDIAEHQEALSYLYHYHLAPSDFCPKALPEHFVDMNLMEKDQLLPRKVFSKLPALIKAYLRVGGVIGNGAVIDPVFETIDVCVVVKTSQISDRHLRYYELENVA